MPVKHFNYTKRNLLGVHSGSGSVQYACVVFVTHVELF